MTTPSSILLAASGVGLAAAPLTAAFEPNYDEAKVPAYTLPEALAMADGTAVADRQAWMEQRRPELLRLFEEQVYGRSPTPPAKLEFTVAERTEDALDGLAIRKQVTIFPGGRKGAPAMNLLIYLPANAKGPVPAFLGLNFYGNQTIHPDPGILITERWVMSNPELGTANNRATEASRGVRQSRWQVATILKRGYALATIYYGDIVPDEPGLAFTQGFIPAFSAERGDARDAAGWSAISAWAWGLSRALDYLAQDPEVNAAQVAVMGHSRLGKAALWAGVQDERFALVISNNSGCGGAALSRRQYGETVARINQSFPHWFCLNFRQYNNREAELPVDQHQLIALIAPRPVYVASAQEDRWADPHGEFLSCRHADPVYRLLGRDGLPDGEMPPVNHPLVGTIGYHLRTGGHSVEEYDWRQYLDFADRHFQR